MRRPACAIWAVSLVIASALLVGNAAAWVPYNVQFDFNTSWSGDYAPGWENSAYRHGDPPVGRMMEYVSGGVGASEQEALEQAKSDYNLRLLFAVSGSGAFLAEVPVTIADPDGQVLLEAVSDGPYFYAKVPPGSYRISAENAGQVQTRSVTVPATGSASQGFYWSAE